MALILEGLIYARIFALKKSSRLILGLSIGMANRNLLEVFTETLRENVALSRTQPCKLKTQKSCVTVGFLICFILNLRVDPPV